MPWNPTAVGRSGAGVVHWDLTAVGWGGNGVLRWFARRCTERGVGEASDIKGWRIAWCPIHHGGLPESCRCL